MSGAAPTSDTGARVGLCTAPEAEAEALARELVERGLVACVHLLPAGRSVYRWQGAVESEPECQMVLKTSAERVAEVTAELAAMHSYEVPEILWLRVDDGLPAYLRWLLDSV